MYKIKVQMMYLIFNFIYFTWNVFCIKVITKKIINNSILSIECTAKLKSMVAILLFLEHWRTNPRETIRKLREQKHNGF